jgi:hypothetical protein
MKVLAAARHPGSAEAIGPVVNGLAPRDTRFY